MTSKSISHYERELILAHILGVSREHILTHLEVKLTSTQEKKFKELTERRLKNEPLAYILGEKNFYGLNFKVNPDILIPRPETEILVEAVLDDLKSAKEKVSLVDVGTGSGNIIISIAKTVKNKKINFYGLDISSQALKVARHNAKKYKLDKKIKFIAGDLLVPLLDTKYKLQDTELIVVSNLPYLSKKIYGKTAPDVRDFEPASALVSGPDGLAHYKKLLQQIKTLRSKYTLWDISCHLEMSPEQKKKLELLVKKHFPKTRVVFGKDLARKWRICSFRP